MLNAKYKVAELRGVAALFLVPRGEAERTRIRSFAALRMAAGQGDGGGTG